jgi:hypothetical protein
MIDFLYNSFAIYLKDDCNDFTRKVKKVVRFMSVPLGFYANNLIIFFSYNTLLYKNDIYFIPLILMSQILLTFLIGYYLKNRYLNGINKIPQLPKSNLIKILSYIISPFIFYSSFFSGIILIKFLQK